MDTVEAAEPPCRTISAGDAAREIGVGVAALIRWAEAGHLRMFVPPGRAMGDGRPGPKGYRIWREDWEAFKAERTTKGPA